MLIEVMFIVALPVLVKVAAICVLLPTAWVPKASGLGARVAMAPVPLPEMVSVFGLLYAFEVTVRMPGRLPLLVGVKVRLMVQLLPGLTEALQLLVCE